MYYYRLHLKSSYVFPSLSSSGWHSACTDPRLLALRTRLAYLPMISESASTCDAHRANSSREFLVAENEPDQVPNYFYVQFGFQGQPEIIICLLR